MSFCKIIKKLAYSATMLVTALATTSCDQVLDNGYGDCTVRYYIDFQYDYNVMEVDAFAKQVKSVAVYAFDENGKLAYQQTDEGEHLALDGYKMQVAWCPTDYTVVAWCGMAGNTTFSLPQTIIGETTLEQLKCRMQRSATNEVGELMALFHGMETNPLPVNPEDKLNPTVVMPLVKNTNTIRIVLQDQGGEPIKADQFEFTITEDNGLMAHDNQLLPDDALTYRPFHTLQGSVDMTETATKASSDNSTANVVIADLSMGRIMADKQPCLKVRNRETGETVFSIPLRDYLLLVKSHYKTHWTDQEYLDRQDEYNMTFFLDDDSKWLSAYILINSWRVVLQDADL
ncbi:MAG: FimB/Mfa2 family fimbrial subunit [Prevotella sp.]|nr:FimB/Mfa2 family fimbrial subunit [Prevotella sp.]